jgi:hypothetical protein
MPLFDQLADRVSAALWNLHPWQAVRLGKHEYDGQVPDLSADALAAGYERLGRLRAQVAGLGGLTADQDFDRQVLLSALDAEVLAGEVADGWHRHPQDYLEVLAVDPYLGRDYAPAGLRLERAAAVLAEAPQVLATARANLAPVLSRPAADLAARQARELAARLALGPSVVVGTAHPAEEQRLRSVASEAAGELRAFAGWLEVERLPAADESFALGSEAVGQLLRAGELLERSLDEVAGLARAALSADRAELAAATAGDRGPGGEEAPAPGGWADAMLAAIERARRFAAEAGLATIPAEIPLAVTGRPSFWCEESRLDAPGPYDAPASGAVLHIGGPEGSPDLAAFDDLAVTATYPGGLLLSARVAAAPTEVLRRFASRAFQEGWALYAGEAMWEVGYRGADPAWHRVWLQRALRADCRLVCSPAVHIGEMSLDQAEGFFMEQAHCDEATARREAERIAVDPGCLSAALGRLEILVLRRRWESRYPDAARGAFHDALLSRGAPPLGLLAPMVLP